MKKNAITKVLIALVMVALLCALCACGGGGNSGGSSGGSSSGSGSGSGSGSSSALPTPTDLGVENGVATWKSEYKGGTYEYIIIDAEGNEGEIQTTADKSVELSEGQSIKVRVVPKSKDASKYEKSAWTEVAVYAAGIQTQIINLVKGIQNYVDVLNATTASDTLSADVAVGGYFVSGGETKSIALAAKANANSTNASCMIDFKLNGVSYVSIGYKDNALYIREPINFINTDEEVANAFKIDVTALSPVLTKGMGAIMDAITGGEPIDIGSVTGMVESFLTEIPMDLNPLIDYNQTGDVVSLGVKMKLLQTALTLLPTLQTQLGMDIGAEVDKYIGYANKAMEALGKEKIKFAGEDLSWNLIKAKINGANEDNSLLKIKATYTGKAITKIELELDLEALDLEGVDYKAGLNVDINTFSTSKTVTIDTTGFTAQDLVIDLGAALGVKDIEADAKAIIRLSDGLAKKGNKLATVTVNASGKDGADNGTATGYITDSGAYVDFTGIFEMLGVTGKTTKYKFEYDSLIDKINGVAAANGAVDDVAGATGIDIAGFISGISAASDKVEYVCGFVYNEILPLIDEDVTPKANAGQADIIKWVFDLELGDTGSQVKDYAKFYNDNTTTFEILLDNIIAINDEAIDTLKAAINTEDKTAGIQFFAPNGDDLLDYVAAFVKIPSIVDGEPNFDELAEINNAGSLKAWLNWIFPADKDARILVEDILGKSLDDVIDTGLYLEATAGEGLAGSVLAASDSEKAETYVALSAAIDLTRTSANTVADIADATAFDAKEEDEYLIANAMKALLDALRAYNKAE